jgi:hypothetical protein
MLQLRRSNFTWAVLWIVSIAFAGLGSYFVGRAAQAKYMDLHTDNTPPLDVKLEEQGRYDEAIQVVLGKIKGGQPAPEYDSRVAWLYLEQARKDWGNREKWTQKSASYSNMAVESAPADPFILETAMGNMDKAADYSENGCPLYEKAQSFGESALALTQGKTITVHGRNYQTQQIREFVQPVLKRIRAKVKAWCSNAAP